MDKGTQTMIENLHKNTGKTIEQWIDIVRKENFSKHGEILKFLKEQHGFTHGFANFIALKSRGADAESAENKDDLIENQYKGKEHFKVLYNMLVTEIQKFGSDIEIAPKNAYVSLKRKKQFATLQPATKTRFEIGLNLKGTNLTGKLEPVLSANAMCSHKITLENIENIDKEVINWIKAAYDNAG